MRSGCFCLLLMLVSGAAHASTIFTLGNNPQPGEENISFSGESGATVLGVTSDSGVDVSFSSSTDNLVTSSSPSAINAADGLINQITLTLPAGTFGDVILNPVINIGGPSGQTLSLTAVSNDGVFTFGYLLGTGNNFVTITTAGGERLSSVSLSAPDGFNSLSQPRISGVEGGVPVPEPVSLSMFSLGLAGIGARRWRAAQAPLAHTPGP